MGPPTDTCFKHLKEELAVNSKPFAVTAIFTGVVCLILFLSHFALYFRPPKQMDEARPQQLSSQFPSKGGANLVPNTSTTQIDINQIEISEMGVTAPSNSGTDYIPKLDSMDPYGNHLQQQQLPDRRRKVTSQFGEGAEGEAGRG